MSDFDSQSAPWNAPWNGHDPASNSSARCGTPQTLVSTSTSEIDGLRTLHLLAAASGDGKRGGHDGVMTKGPLSVSPESSITADDTPRPPLRQPWRPFLPPQLGKNTMMPCADGKTVGTRPAAAQAPNWSQNPELVVLERTRMRHGPEHDVSPVGQAVFDWTKELDAVALARAREVTGKYLSGAGSTQGGAVEAAFYRTIPSAAQALWQTHNPDARCISHPRRVHEPPSALPDSPRHLPRHEKPSMAGKAACAPARPASVVRWQEGQWDHDKAEEPAWPRPSSPRRPAPQDGGAVEPGPAYREHKEAAIKEPKLRRACGSGAGQYLKFKPSKDLGGIGLGVRPSRLPVSREHCLGWLPEMLWCLFSVACLAAIAGLLARYNGRPLPAWPLGISLNALVAFLTTLCRAGFVVPVLQGLAQLKWNWFARAERPMGDFQVYEDAQRDPLGSLRLLFSGRGR